jgi:hypothetical protein
VPQRLLAGPQRAVAPAVPHLGEQPAERAAVQPHAAHEPHAVAEAGRVPQPQPVALGAGQQQVAIGELGHVRRVAHLADVAAEQRAGQRRLADVGVGDETERDVGHRGRSGLP